MRNFDEKMSYSTAPARMSNSSISVNVNEMRIEKRKSIILPSNHHQKTIHRTIIILLKCKSLGNGIF